MQTKILRVVAQGEPAYVPEKAAVKREQSQACLNSAEREQTRPQVKKSENGQLAKCMIKLKELGGDYEDEYICAMFGNLALCKFAPGSIVAAALRFQTREQFQDIVANDIVKI